MFVNYLIFETSLGVLFLQFSISPMCTKYLMVKVALVARNPKRRSFGSEGVYICLSIIILVPSRKWSYLYLNTKRVGADESSSVLTKRPY